MIVPVKEGFIQGPVVVTVYEKAPLTFGVPVMVTTLPLIELVTPPGKPVTVAPVPSPPIVYTILVMAVLIQSDWVVVDNDDVRVIVEFACTVIVPVNDGLIQGPVVVTVKGKLPLTFGAPLIVNILPLIEPVTPPGRPVTVAPVALPPMVYLIAVILVLIHTV